MSTNYKHLTLDERKEIERLLNIDSKLGTIAKSIGKSDKCVRYEVTNYREPVVDKRRSNLCGNFYNCEHIRLCSHCLSGNCKYCKHMNCNEICDDFTSFPNCKRVNRFPLVCNGCKEIDKCILPKFIYYSEKANFKAKNNISSWRYGIKKSDKELAYILDIVAKGIKKGHSLEVIINDNNLPISVSTLYRYIDIRSLGSIKNIDLKRKVRYTLKPKKIKTTPIDYEYLKNREFNDYHEYVLNNHPSNIWQMDTIMGLKKDNKCVLSLLHCLTNLQLFFLLDDLDCLSVNKVFDKLKDVLGVELFKSTFEVILTDNGREFKDPLSIEIDGYTGEALTRVFFCESRRSDQKGKCEKNHEHFREVIPKGNSMEALNQSDINYVSNMVNNYPRKSLGFKSPLEIAINILNKKVLALNSLVSIPLDQVKLIPFKK